LIGNRSRADCATLSSITVDQKAWRQKCSNRPQGGIEQRQLVASSTLADTLPDDQVRWSAQVTASVNP